MMAAALPFCNSPAPANWGCCRVRFANTPNAAVRCRLISNRSSRPQRVRCCSGGATPAISGMLGKLVGPMYTDISQTYRLSLPAANASLRISSKLRSLISCLPSPSSTRPSACVDNVCTNWSRMVSIAGAGVLFSIDFDHMPIKLSLNRLRSNFIILRANATKRWNHLLTAKCAK